MKQYFVNFFLLLIVNRNVLICELMWTLFCTLACSGIDNTKRRLDVSIHYVYI